MNKTLILFMLLLGIAGTIVFTNQYGILDLLLKDTSPPEAVLEGFLTTEDLALIEKMPEKEVATAPPIRIEQTDSPSSLTKSGVFIWTNTHRSIDGLPFLTENTQLNEAAAAKVQDMFELQYFAHVSPTERDAGDFVKDSRYEFLIVGENLALGNYEDDETLVQAWMDSPGHRENILNERYREIGIAVGQGIYEEQSTWLAVQIFGLSLSSCSYPSEILHVQIDTNQKESDELEQALTTKKEELGDIRPKRGSLYGQAVDEYNALVYTYNTLARELKQLVIQYNAQVEVFNECLRG